MADGSTYSPRHEIPGIIQHHARMYGDDVLIPYPTVKKYAGSLKETYYLCLMIMAKNDPDRIQSLENEVKRMYDAQ